MRKCDVWGLVMLLHHIDHSIEVLKPMAESKELRDEEVDSDSVSTWLNGNITMARINSGLIGLNATHSRVWEGGGPFWMKAKTGITWQEACSELRVLRQCIEADLENKWFAFVLPEKAALLESAKKEWKETIDSVPDAEEDVREALYCYALERNTASVFHLMRVAEHGLRILGKRLRVSLAIKHKGHVIPIDYAEWQKVIDAIKNKLDKVKHLPSGPKRAAQLEKLSDAGDHCLFMKDIWRNAISHARRPYTPDEAKAALGRVKDFMTFVAKEFAPRRATPLVPSESENKNFYGG
jgi:hypothetical protein